MVPFVDVKVDSVHETLPNRIKKGRPWSQQAPRAHHAGADEPAVRCRKTTRGTRTPGTPNACDELSEPLRELDCYRNDERTAKNVWSCCKIFTKPCVRSAVLDWHAKELPLFCGDF
ncbi:MAG: hypothetical protein DMG46_09210 [Acidobacteria bacterium]|nr:MAG: hypothetical protein DMG46_09210 [Acidobacteriota bacterium]